MKKKGQAAMEFIMTYGWAILVILVIIGALVYFGVISPERLLPERCSFPADLQCVGKARSDSTADTLTFALVNNVGYPITMSNVISGESTTSCANPVMYSINGQLASNVTVVNGQQITLVVNCSGMEDGRFTADLTVNYVNSQNGITYPITGEIRSQAK